MNPSQNQPTDPQRFEFVDALRGWAILAVMWCHAGLLQQAPNFFKNAINSGNRGVQLFYLVSSFTLFWSLHSRKANETHWVRNFFIRRFFRIAPMFYLAVLIYQVTNVFDRTYYAPEGIHASHVISTLTFTNGWHPSYINSVVPGGWSVAVESNFYLLLPILFLFVKNGRQALWLLWTMLIGMWVLQRIASGKLEKTYSAELLPANPQAMLYTKLLDNFLYSWLPNQMSVFCLGIAFYFLFVSYNKEKYGRKESLLMLFFSVTLMCALQREHRLDFIPNHFLFGLAFMLFSWAMAVHPWSFFVNPFTRYIGKISFSLYLVHFAMFPIVRMILGNGFFIPEKSFPRYLAGLLVLIALSVPVASLGYYLIENPGMALGKKLIKKLGS